MKIILWILRIAVGLLFIFSGLVKANDPLGLTYKMNEFFEVWGMSFMLQYSLYLSVAMIVFEITSGVAMIIGNYFKLWVTLLLLLNIFFTFLTGYALYSGKIKECGCFGDCIKISNTATFYKDVVLTVAVFILYIFKNRVKPVFRNYSINVGLVSVGGALALFLQLWVLSHLPFYDCLPYKIGNNIFMKTKPGPDYKEAEFKTTFIYEKAGEKKEFTAENYPWQDTTWKFVSSQSVEVKPATGLPEIHDFVLTDVDNVDQTAQILTTKGKVYIWFVREPNKAHLETIDQIKLLAKKAKSENIPFYVACSSGRDVCISLQESWDMKDVAFLTLDLTASKTAIRTNPGLMLLNNGVVSGKWGYLDYPDSL